MKRTIVTLSLLSTLAFSNLVYAEQNQPTLMDEFFQKNEISVLQKYDIKELNNITLKPLMTNQGLIYLDADKGVFFAGTSPMRLNPQTKSLEGLDSQIISNYLHSVPMKVTKKAKNEKSKLQVFTDVSCSYCQLHHTEEQKYLDNGITLEYLLFPRNGINDDVALRMSSIQSTDNQFDALGKAMEGGFLPRSNEVSKQVLEHAKAAKALQINSTPTMFLNGVRINGYIPADAIIKQVNSIN